MRMRGAWHADGKIYQTLADQNVQKSLDICQIVFVVLPINPLIFPIIPPDLLDIPFRFRVRDTCHERG